MWGTLLSTVVGAAATSLLDMGKSSGGSSGGSSQSSGGGFNAFQNAMSHNAAQSLMSPVNTPRQRQRQSSSPAPASNHPLAQWTNAFRGNN